jgi:hypothetical protein
MIQIFPTLTEALIAHAPAVKNTDQVATRCLKNLKSRFPSATHAVLFVNQAFDSSQFGAWHVLAIGPDNTYKNLDEINNKHLNEMPSLRQYPVAAIELKRILDV